MFNTSVIFQKLSRIKMKHPHFKLRLLVGSALINAICLPVLVIYWRSIRTDYSEPVLCLDIDDEGSPDLKSQLIVLTDKNIDRNRRCGKLSDILDLIVSEVITEKYNNDANPEHYQLSFEEYGCKPFYKRNIQLRLENISSKAKPVEDQMTMVFWEQPAEQFGQGATYLETEGAIHIMQSGHYYVSSQLTTRTENVSLIDERYKVIHHLVFLVSNGKQRVLLENIKTMCEIAEGHADWSSNIGAVFHLEKHDRIFVATSHPYNLVTGLGDNHFSIHEI